MTTPANLTFTDIQTRVMNNLRLPVSNTAEATKIAATINEVYRDICAKQDWWWLIKRATLNSTPRIDVTVSLALDSVNGTYSTAPAQNGVDVSTLNFSLCPTGATEDPDAKYYVTSHVVSATAINLDAGYTNATSTAVAAKLYQDRIALPSDCAKVLNVMRYGRPRPLRRAGIEEMNWLKLTDRSEGSPETYSVYDYGTTGTPTTQRWLQIHPFPDGNYHRLEVYYKQNLNTELSGTTQPFIPDDYSQVLVYGALARSYPIYMDDTERGKYFQQLFNDMMALMAAQQKEYAKDQSGIAPDNLYRRGRRPQSNVSLGNWFDRWPSGP